MRFLCSLGWHSWRFLEMGSKKTIDIPGGPIFHTYTWKKRCKRCGLVHTTIDGELPRRVKT